MTHDDHDRHADGGRTLITGGTGRAFVRAAPTGVWDVARRESVAR